MDELCPLCLKMGANRKIKAIQINLEEALWTCESEECPWPFFGHDEPTFFPRKVGEKWAYEWQVYRRVKERIGSIPVSTELSLYTPPVTPSSDASAKEALQSDVGKHSLESTTCTDIFSNNTSPRDSYAPRSAAEITPLLHEKVGSGENSNSAENVPSLYDINSEAAEKLPVRSSIFDVDSEDFISGNINTKLCPDPELSDRLESANCDTKNSTPLIDRRDTVLKTVPTSDFTVKSAKIKREVTDYKDNGEHAAKRVPQIRSIARANIDLQKFDPAAVLKIEKPTKKVETPPTPLTRESVDTAEELMSPTKRTTTIKVDGIPPIVLSYDLTDLGGSGAEILPATSTPIPLQKSSQIAEDHDKETAETPKKQTRISAKRRFANSGKAFEKFSFGALKKAAKQPNTKDATPAVKTEPPQLEEIINCNRTCISGNDNPSSTRESVASNAIANSYVGGAVNSSQRVEALDSTNPDTNCSIANPAVDNLNLSCLIDDMLLDGYQNATQNLNDDWLQSFFSENT